MVAKTVIATAIRAQHTVTMYTNLRAPPMFVAETAVNTGPTMLNNMVMRSVPVAVIMPIPTPKSFGSSWLITSGLKDAPLSASVKPVMPMWCGA